MASKKIYPFSHHYSIQAVPFDSVEDAWFWFIAAQEAKNDGARVVAGQGHAVRPCEPLDILKVLDRLYRQRLLMRDHLLVLRHYGQRHMAPDPRRSREARASTLWEEAMMRLEVVLERKGIVRPNDEFCERRDVPDWAYETGWFEEGSVE